MRRRRASGSSAINAAKWRAGRPRKRVKTHRLFIVNGRVSRSVDGRPRAEDIPIPLQENATLFQLFLCLSRACLGKMIVFYV